MAEHLVDPNRRAPGVPGERSVPGVCVWPALGYLSVSRIGTVPSPGRHAAFQKKPAAPRDRAEPCVSLSPSRAQQWERVGRDRASPLSFPAAMCNFRKTVSFPSRSRGSTVCVTATLLRMAVIFLAKTDWRGGGVAVNAREPNGPSSARGRRAERPAAGKSGERPC